VAEQGCLLISKDAETKGLPHSPVFTTIYQKSFAYKQLSSKCCQMLSARGSDKIGDSRSARSGCIGLQAFAALPF
jgi:hypothetical protein